MDCRVWHSVPLFVAAVPIWRKQTSEKPRPMPQSAIPVVFDARSVDELGSAVHDHLRARLLDVHTAPGGIASLARMTKAASSELWFCDYGTLVELSFPESDYLRIQIPLKGASVTTVGRSRSIVTADAACISSAAASIRFQPDFRQFVWRVPQSAILRKLTALAGSPSDRKLTFSPGLDLSTMQGRLLRNLVESFAGATNLPSAPLLCSEIEQAMITILLDGPLRDGSKLLEKKPPELAPRQVRNVEEYIEAHWDEALDYETLAAVSGASVRSLFRTFRTFRGYTPMEFARKIRLMRARKILAEADRSVSISTIAAWCGYSSLSVFSRDFARAYCMPPSAARGR